MGSGLARIVSLLAVPLALSGGHRRGRRPPIAPAIRTRSAPAAPSSSIRASMRRIGTMDYAETLPLVDQRSGAHLRRRPDPALYRQDSRHPRRRMRQGDLFHRRHAWRREYPALVRRVYDEGHTIGTHSMSHPIRFRALSAERGNAQIDDGIAATAAALGDADKLAPFFRFPGFGHTAAGPRTRRRARPDGLGRRRAGRRLAQARPARGGPPRGAAAGSTRARASCCCTTSISEPWMRCRSFSRS